MSIRRLMQGGVVVAVGILCVSAWRAGAQGKAVVWPADGIKWTDNVAVAGAKQAVLWGDPTKGAYGALKQVPGGTVLALHSHKNESRVIVIKGTVALEIEGKTTAMGAGSYALIPGSVPHQATCRGTAACEYFEEMSGAFDSTPAKK